MKSVSSDKQAKRDLFDGKRGNPMSAPRCLALTRNGTPCQRAAEKNPATGKRLRCRLHGGLSTGPTSSEGKNRSAAAGLVHGRYSKAAWQVAAERRRKLGALKVQREDIGT